MTKNSLLEQAERNVVGNARYWADMLHLCDALANVGNNACHEYIGKGKFFEGLQMMRSAMHDEFANAIVNCFTFAGVGGKEAIKFSKERFGEVFHDDPNKLKNSVMQFLDAHGQIPRSWRTEDDLCLRKEAKEKIKQFRKRKI